MREMAFLPAELFESRSCVQSSNLIPVSIHGAGPAETRERPQLGARSKRSIARIRAVRPAAFQNCFLFSIMIQAAWNEETTATVRLGNRAGQSPNARFL